MATRSPRKRAREKLEADHASHGQVVPIPPLWRRTMGKGTLLIPRPLDVDDAMRAVRKGRLLTMSALRAKLASDAGADAACPATTGIFARLAAEAAEEDRAAGKSRITPWWRTIKDDGRLNASSPAAYAPRHACSAPRGTRSSKGARQTCCG